MSAAGEVYERIAAEAGEAIDKLPGSTNIGTEAGFAAWKASVAASDALKLVKRLAEQLAHERNPF